MKIQHSNIDYFYINLDSRTDRRISVENVLSKKNIKATRFSALTGNDTYQELEIPATYTPGNRGCLLSHYKLWNEFDQSKGSILGIFEDDMYLCDDYHERFKYIEDNFNKDWDIFYLSSFYHLNDDSNRWKDIEFEFTNIKYIHRVYSSFCTHSYLVNPNSINKLIRLAKEYLKDSYAIDHLLILIQNYLNCYAFTPGMSMQKNDWSDIANEVRDQESFIYKAGKHIYASNLNNFNYDEFFNQHTSV